LLHLSIIRQHYDMGFMSVLNLVEELEQQIESLTLANQSPSHISCQKQTISNQQQKIQRLSEIIENKTKEFFKLNQDNHQAQNKLENRLSKER
jgi:hypothetical protein